MKRMISVLVLVGFVIGLVPVTANAQQRRPPVTRQAAQPRQTVVVVQQPRPYYRPTYRPTYSHPRYEYGQYNRPYGNSGYQRWDNPVRDLAIIGGVVATAAIVSKAISKNRQSRENAENIAVQNEPQVRPVAGPGASSGEGKFSLENSTNFMLEVYYDGKSIGQLNPGENMRVDYPVSGKKYSAHMAIPNREGGTSSLEATIYPGNTGIQFVEPDTGQGR